jgi:hypothetical protein
MLGDEFAKFIDTDLEEEIDADPLAQQQLRAGVFVNAFIRIITQP